MNPLRTGVDPLSVDIPLASFQEIHYATCQEWPLPLWPFWATSAKPSSSSSSLKRLTSFSVLHSYLELFLAHDIDFPNFGAPLGDRGSTLTDCSNH